MKRIKEFHQINYMKRIEIYDAMCYTLYEHAKLPGQLTLATLNIKGGKDIRDAVSFQKILEREICYV